jgi:hypothetical protein
MPALLSRVVQIAASRRRTSYFLSFPISDLVAGHGWHNSWSDQYRVD